MNRSLESAEAEIDQTRALVVARFTVWLWDLAKCRRGTANDAPWAHLPVIQRAYAVAFNLSKTNQPERNQRADWLTSRSFLALSHHFDTLSLPDLTRLCLDTVATYNGDVKPCL